MLGQYPISEERMFEHKEVEHKDLEDKVLPILEKIGCLNRL